MNTCFNDLRSRGRISHLAFSTVVDSPETTVNGYKPILVSTLCDLFFSEFTTVMQVNILLEPITGGLHTREFAIVFQALLLIGMQQVDQRQSLVVDLINILGSHESFYDADGTAFL